MCRGGGGGNLFFFSALLLLCPHSLVACLLSLPAPAGVENAFYEGPLRLRLPVSMQLDPDGAFSFEVPLPSATGKFGTVRWGGQPCGWVSGWGWGGWDFGGERCSNGIN